MVYLILSILCTASFTLLFKSFERYHIHVFQAIVFNYWVATFCGLFFLADSSFLKILTASWLWFAFVMGVSFITVFNTVSKTVKYFSVSAASVSMKLGLVFPVLFAFIFYDEGYNKLKLLGIAFAFVAVVLATYRHSKEHHQHAKWQYFLPFIVFIGSGLCDSGVQYANKELLQTSDVGPFVMMNFFAAALAGSAALSYHIISKQATLQWKDAVAGIALGIPNYFSYFLMLLALESMTWGSSVIFPVSNLSTIGCSTIAAFVLFRERISVVNAIGLCFATASIVIITLSN